MLLNKNRKSSPEPTRPRRIMDMYVPGNQPRPVTSRSLPPKPQVSSAQKPPAAKHSSDIQAPSAKFWLAFLLIIIVIGAGASSAYYFIRYKPNRKPGTSNKTVANNTNHIVDDTVGLKFIISKDLTAVDKAQLVKRNPSFIYGFEQKDVPNVNCTLSQQKRDPPGGAVNPASLRDGTIDGLKKAFPDVKLDDYQDILLTNGQDAASLTLHYTDNKTAIKERMLVAATANNVTFAFCTSPTPLFSYYDTKFRPFFDSLEVY